MNVLLIFSLFFFAFANASSKEDKEEIIESSGAIIPSLYDMILTSFMDQMSWSSDYTAIQLVLGLRMNVPLFPDGSNILHFASRKREIDLLKLVIASDRFDINEPHCNTFTPLHFVCVGTENPDNSVEAAKLLIQNGANIEALTGDNFTPLHLAIERSNAELVEFLLSAGARTDHVHPETGNSILHFAMEFCIARPIMKTLIDRDPRLMDSININNAYPIHTAALFGCVTGLRELIFTRKQDKNRKTRSRAECQWPPVGYFLARNRDDPKFALFNSDPLHYAVSGDKYTATKFLILIGVDLEGPFNGVAGHFITEEPMSHCDIAAVGELVSFIVNCRRWRRENRKRWLRDDVEEALRVIDETLDFDSKYQQLCDHYFPFIKKETWNYRDVRWLGL